MKYQRQAGYYPASTGLTLSNCASDIADIRVILPEEIEQELWVEIQFGSAILKRAVRC